MELHDAFVRQFRCSIQTQHDASKRCSLSTRGTVAAIERQMEGGGSCANRQTAAIISQTKEHRGLTHCNAW